MEVLGVIVLLLILILWVGGAFFYFQLGVRGIKQFLIHLGVQALIIFILWLIILAPVSDCTGFLCGLGEALKLIGLSLLSLLIGGFVVYFMGRNYKDKIKSQQSRKSSEEEETIDATF